MMKTLSNKSNRWLTSGILLASFFAMLWFQGCRLAGKKGNQVTLVLGAYTTPREAYSKAIIPAFQKYWKEKSNQDVEFRESYQGSGAQARAIIGGFEADIAALSLAADTEKISQAGLITRDWKSKPHGGMVSSSIVVIAVRPGNPKAIKDWADLTLPGLNVLTPDPKTSGGAMWNVNAIYGAALRGFTDVPKGDPAAANQFLEGVFRNVSIMDKGARESITNFERGVGDPAITYENEVLVARAAGEKYEYVVPRSTILIENPVALVDRYVDKHGVREVAEAFMTFLWRKEAQRGYAKHGLRPVDPQVARETRSLFPPVTDLWKIDFLGGWKKVIGSLLNFGRALGEFGAIVVVAGNIPGRTLTAAVHIYGQIESQNQRAASAMSILLLALSFSLLLAVNWMQRRKEVPHAGI